MPPVVGVNLDEVVEKPPLPNDDYTFVIRKSELRQAKNPNKNTGQKEWMVFCELVPQEKPDYVVFHNWVLSPGALESSDAPMSIKKFFSIVGFQWNSDGTFNTEDIVNLRFIGHTTLENWNGKLNPKLSAVIKGVE
jgi:hypothetical protein